MRGPELTPGIILKRASGARSAIESAVGRISEFGGGIDLAVNEGERIGGLRVRFTRMVPMLDFPGPFFAPALLQWNTLPHFLHRKN